MPTGMIMTLRAIVAASATSGGASVPLEWRMDPRIEHLFRMREEFQMEIDASTKERLRAALFAEVEVFLKDHGLHLSAWDFIAATAEFFKNWKRNPH